MEHTVDPTDSVGSTLLAPVSERPAYSGLHLNGEAPVPTTTKVLNHAGFICDNSINVFVDMDGTKAAAKRIWQQMQTKGYGFEAWNANPLHPSVERDGADFTLDFIFTVDVLNFSFWSLRPDGLEGEDGRFSIEWEGKKHTGYWSLIAALQRALHEGIPITSPSFWNSDDFTHDVLANVFRSATTEPIPLLNERFDCLREAGAVLATHFDGKVSSLVTRADRSAGRLVNLLVRYLACFRDEHEFHRERVQILKRAQIFVADVWAAFKGTQYGHFDDIDRITMFADYRVPQMLHAMKSLTYSYQLEQHIRSQKEIPSGSVWEVEMRGCSIWCVEKIRQLINKAHPEERVNAILIDFFLYDTVKELEAEMLAKTSRERISPLNGLNGSADGTLTVREELAPMMPHHRTRSIWY